MVSYKKPVKEDAHTEEKEVIAEKLEDIENNLEVIDIVHFWFLLRYT